ncbi:YhcN/YlaJ family sporulation lipoprotein [Bacillus sp. CGMCC 1.16541]|uniref:YhcN/YlaJ family sporulation lipoprotein n=1 Tax=Bacillus sp. CGMCC 1.16541 TaxID=2185143 RepID=UPI000D726C94|nr:YhcN/YlaJ family sporulation lipoprotein [Bacillus sp. CGMCC 1.16541]
MKNWIILTSLCCCLTLLGCNNQTNTADEDLNEKQLITVKNTAPQPVKNQTSTQVSQHLVEIATRVPNVKDATAIVVGKYAIVGIDVNNKMDRSEVSSIKYTVAESLKNDPYGANSVVIADPDTFARLRQIGHEIQQGRPVTGFLDELAAIVNRVMPEISEDIRKNPTPTETNDEKLNKEEQKQLKNTQKEQSNQQLEKNKYNQ